MTTSPTPNQPLPPELLTRVALGGARDAGGVDPALLGDFLPSLVDAVAAGRRLDRAELAACREHGRAAAVDGVALRALLDLYLSAAWRLWEHLPEVLAAGDDPAGVVRAGQAMLRATDDGVAALAEGFQLARRELVRAEVSARREFIDDLLNGAADVVALLDRARRFGLTLTGPHAALVVAADRPFVDNSPLTGIVERAVLGSKADADALVATKEGRLVVVFAAPDREAVAQMVRRVTRTLPGDDEGVHLQRRVTVGSWQLAVGRAFAGAAGVRASYDDAREALELAARLGRTTPVLDATDLLLYRVLLRDEPAIRDLVETALSPLAAAKGGARPLLTTLASYFDLGGNAAATARALHLSVRAVTYRLARVRELTGHDPEDPLQRYALQTAVLGAQLLGWEPTA